MYNLVSSNQNVCDIILLFQCFLIMLVIHSRSAHQNAFVVFLICDLQSFIHCFWDANTEVSWNNLYISTAHSILLIINTQINIFSFFFFLSPWFGSTFSWSLSLWSYIDLYIYARSGSSILHNWVIIYPIFRVITGFHNHLDHRVWYKQHFPVDHFYIYWWNGLWSTTSRRSLFF